MEIIAFLLPSRLCLYDMIQSRVTLMAQHGSDQHQVLVCTKLVEPFHAQVGSLYIVLGELQHQQGELRPQTPFLILGHELGQSSGQSVRNVLVTQQQCLIRVSVSSKLAHKFNTLEDSTQSGLASWCQLKDRVAGQEFETSLANVAKPSLY